MRLRSCVLVCCSQIFIAQVGQARALATDEADGGVTSRQRHLFQPGLEASSLAVMATASEIELSELLRLEAKIFLKYKGVTWMTHFIHLRAFTCVYIP